MRAAFILCSMTRYCMYVCARVSGRCRVPFSEGFLRCLPTSGCHTHRETGATTESIPYSISTQFFKTNDKQDGHIL